MFIKLLFLISEIMISLRFNKDLEKTKFKFVSVSRVLPDLEIIIKQEFFKFLNLLNCEYKFLSKLSKKIGFS